ncbi:protein O-linked-mannose beta-1,2-N-acetylglucosaminyltransferase 1-like [Haliotis rufescens]|uniref:protein O-linked-mannose beta-1,2-N-acetylglucosaminyltransferase 1-like n=1 Tax=Haliotis rufescens TaxID=6454 RepID=UPI001EAFF672|nr:protein O-linked-mannose beta-1,2-N-acetylglucosaminyltransferase 1-like [Haliotis rufescens]XP_046354649.1 protein O-linked-mannose beta-1,2-N-acetylglucosaminyltransferase 1-like [Haliotis rufescens]
MAKKSKRRSSNSSSSHDTLTMMVRGLRRLVIKKFGGMRRFLLIAVCVGVILYCVQAILAGSNRQIWDVRGSWNLSDSRCGVKCENNQLAFYVRTGDGNKAGPTICFEGEVLISPEMKNFGRGLNIISISEKTFDVTDIKTFDTYVEDSGLIRFLKKMPAETVIIMTSYDEVSSSLKEDGKRWLKYFGSSGADNLQFRDGFLMIGQKGLQEGHAIEYVVKRKNHQDFSDVMEKAGCFSLPMGPKRDLQMLLPRVIHQKEMELGPTMANCGVPESCGPHSFPVSVFSGEGNKVQPEICVSGHLMMTENLNNGGRGFNVLVVDPDNGVPKMISRVDTYTYDSTDLEILLESLGDRDIIISLVADDGAKKLGYMARELMNQLGSGLIQNLRFRDVWFFVGQKGIEGFTQMEQISYAGFEGEWPKIIKKSFCVPRKIKGQKIVPDPDVYRNDARREFCKKYDGYPEFCDPTHVDDFLKPVGVVDKALQSHRIFSTPIIVVPGLNHNALVRTLETTLMQPGMKPDMVAVMWDEKFPEHGELADLFGFRNASLKGSVQYFEQMAKALRKIDLVYPDSSHVIVLEEELLLAPNFLHFMSHFLPVLDADDSLMGVSAWNYNGFEKLSGNKNLIYRVEEFPGLGFLLKSKPFLKILTSSIHKCCKDRAWAGWRLSVDYKGEILVPDMSRVFRQPYQGADTSKELVTQLFGKPRTTLLDGPTPLTGMSNLTMVLYEQQLNHNIASGVSFPITDLQLCVQKVKDFDLKISPDEKRPLVVFYAQDSPSDYALLRELCRCFGLFAAEHYKPRNLHRGLLRFFFQGHDVYLVGSATEYFKHKPALVSMISKNLLQS